MKQDLVRARERSIQAAEKLSEIRKLTAEVTQLQSKIRRLLAETWELTSLAAGEDPGWNAPATIKPIHATSLSTRARNCCKANNIFVLGDLAKLSENEVRDFPNVGRAVMNEFCDVLAKHNLRFGLKVPGR